MADDLGLVVHTLRRPFHEELAGAVLGVVFPEALLQQIGPAAAEIQLFEISGPGALFVGEILGILRPNMAGLFQQFRIGLLHILISPVLTRI